MSLILKRLARPEDARTLVELMPSFRYSYGNGIDADMLTDLMSGLFHEKAISGVILLNSDAGDGSSMPTRPIGNDQVVSFAVTGFISLELAQTIVECQVCTPLVEWLYARELANDPVFLRPDEQARCNHGDGMALVFLHFFAPPGDPTDPMVQKGVAEMQQCFRLQHGGFNCRLALHPLGEGDDDMGRKSLLGMGFDPLGDGRQLMWLDLAKLAEMPFHPFVCLLRTDEPRLGLSLGEKRLLTLALWGYADHAIADALCIAVETVRKRWRNIFLKIEEHPEVLLFNDAQSTAEATRGREKRSVVLRYLDSHLSEIRP